MGPEKTMIFIILSSFFEDSPFSSWELLGTTFGRSWGSFWRLWGAYWATLGAKMAPKVAQVTQNVGSSFGVKFEVRFFGLTGSVADGSTVAEFQAPVQLFSWRKLEELEVISHALHHGVMRRIPLPPAKPHCLRPNPTVQLLG